MLRKKTEWLRKVDKMSEERLEKAVYICVRDDREETKWETVKAIGR